MFDVSDAHRFRKSVAGLCMILCPVLFLAASIVAPGFDSDEAAFAALIAESPDAFAASQALALAGWALFVPAVLGLMHMLRERGTTEGHLGGLLAIVGTVAAIAQTGSGLALWQAGSAEQTAALMTALNDSTLATVVLFILPLGVTLGAVVLGWALYRMHFAEPWVATAVGGAGILFAIGSVAYSQAIYIAASAVLLAGFGMLGRRVLSESVEDWDHTPQLAAGTR